MPTAAGLAWAWQPGISQLITFCCLLAFGYQDSPSAWQQLKQALGRVAVARATLAFGPGRHLVQLAEEECPRLGIDRPRPAANLHIDRRSVGSHWLLLILACGQLARTGAAGRQPAGRRQRQATLEAGRGG